MTEATKCPCEQCADFCTCNAPTASGPTCCCGEVCSCQGACACPSSCGCPANAAKR